MGQEESRIESSQVPGYNPQTGGKRQGVITQQRRSSAEPRPSGPSLEQEQDAFFRYADVRDHIRPIVERDTRQSKEELDETQDADSSLRKLLNELGVGKKIKDEDEEGKEAFGFGKTNNGDESSSEDTEGADEDRGVFHHEVKFNARENISVYSSEAHLITALGECCVGEKLHFKDLSEWASQYPVYRIEWFVGDEIGSQTTFKAVALREGPMFEVAVDQVGRYIQIIATRRVEHQLRGTYQEEVKGGVFDPHVRKAKHVETGTERQYVDVRSQLIVGPVMISDSWSLLLTKSLAEGYFSVAIKLRDDLLKSNNGQSEEHSLTGKTLLKVPGSILVNYERIEITYEVNDSHKRDMNQSSLFSLEWLKRLVGLEHSINSSTSYISDATMQAGSAVARLKLKSTHVRPGDSRRTIVLATVGKKRCRQETQDLIRFDVDPAVGRDVCLFELLAFQGARKFKDKDNWSGTLSQGDLYRAKELLQRYLEDLSGTVEADTVVYEEILGSPWGE